MKTKEQFMWEHLEFIWDDQDSHWDFEDLEEIAKDQLILGLSGLEPEMICGEDE